MAKGHGKGSAFEREICKLLGMWWTGGERDDIFWRSTISGGRATARGRQGKTTAGQYGDIQATDRSGEVLLQVCSIELKRGYNHTSAGDLLDVPETGKVPVWQEWAKQSRDSARLIKSRSWLVVTKRDRREAVVFGPLLLARNLDRCGACLHSTKPFLEVWPRRRKGRPSTALFATTLKEFLAAVSPANVQDLHRELGGTE